MFVCENIRGEDYLSIVNKKLNHESFELLERSVKPLGHTSGIFGEHYLLSVSIRRNKKVEKLNFFLKTLPRAEAQKKFTLEVGAFYKEVKMFDVLMPQLTELGMNSAPKHYFSEMDKILVFEDLSCKGYRSLNARQSYNWDLVKLSIRAMVELHASGIKLEEKLGVRLNVKYREEFKEMLYNGGKSSNDLLEACVKGTRTQIEHFLTDLPDFQSFAAEQIRNFTGHVKESKFQNTICHGDLWASNIMFKQEKGEETKCVLVDFQSYRYTPPAQDLLTFLYLTTDREFRAEHFNQAVDYYYECLIGKLENSRLKPTRDEFNLSLEEAEIFAIAQTVTHFQIVMMNSDEMSEFLSDPEDNRKCMYEDRSDVILRICQKDEFYERKQRESITDLYELYLRRQNIN